MFGLAALSFTGCVKQSDCDCGMKGKFVYDPYWSEGYNRTIKAYFIPDDIYYSYYRIEGFVPKDFRITDTLYVTICTTGREMSPNKDDVDVLFKLDCIELAE